MGYTNIIKVLVIDDSYVFCHLLEEGISIDQRIQVVGTAADPFDARDKILELNPDVITLDIELPRMDGISFLKKLIPQYPIPAVVVSCHYDTILEALDSGAVDFLQKPVSNDPSILQQFFLELIVKIKIASIANVSAFKQGNMQRKRIDAKSPQLIAIGASTGGTEAISSLIRELPVHMPGIVIVQHMPEVFTRMYSERLNATSRLEVKEASDGDVVLPGRVLIAPGGFQMKIIKSGGKFSVRCFSSDKVNGHRPSVDVLFYSVAKEIGKNAIGVILTGMGYDGAKGLLEMKRSGAYTIGQDEESCVVYGMPKVAYDIGGVMEQLPLDKIAQRLYTLSDH